MRSRGLALIAAAALSAACGTRQPAADASLPTRQFPPLQIPAMYTAPADRSAYTAEHFWDRFLSTSAFYLCDSSTVNGVPAAELENQFSTFVAIIEDNDIATARKGVKALFSKVEALQKADSLSNVFDRFGKLAEKYLYDPNSPYRNEDIYLPYLQGLISSSLTDTLMIPSYRHAARLCALNPVGTPAADFHFVDIAGRTRTLYGVKAEYTLLFFSNPGCAACKDIIDNLIDVPHISGLVSSGRLAVVNVYIDEDLAAWKDYQEIYPREWYNGYDPTFTIRTDLTYSVRAIPSLYVLDSEKRVIMKDAPEERVFAFLGNL